MFAPASAHPRDLLDLLSGDEPDARLSHLHALWNRSGLILLLLAVASLLVRPADLLPALEGAPIYECLVVACLAASLPRVMSLLRAQSLRQNPVVAFVLLLIPAVLCSHLFNGNTYDARLGAFEVAKACTFFLLVVAQIDSFDRLLTLLFSMAGCVFVVALLALAQYFGAIHVPALAGVEQRMIDSSGDATVLYRLCGIGVFNDPNDFSLVLVGSIIISCYALGRRGEHRAWLLMIVPLMTCTLALLLTHSRGGLVAAAGGLAAFLSVRLGKRNTLVIACLLMPIVLFALLGRQTTTEPADPDDTFQTRLELWSSSLDVFRAAPIFGLGQGKLAEEIGQVAHNSFMHAYAEMGLFGGTAFFGAFYILLKSLGAVTPADTRASRLQPYVLAMVAAYTVGLLSLSRCYTVPTQLILGLGTASVIVFSRNGYAVLPRMGSRCFARVAGAGMVFLGITYVFLRLMLQRGQA